jgi:Zn-dependent protease with chaperone function
MKTKSTLALAAILTLLALPLFAGEPPRSASPPVETLSFPLASGGTLDLTVTEEMRNHSHTRYALYFASNALALAVLALFLYARFGAWVRGRIERRVKNQFVVAMLTAAAIVAAGTVLTFSLTIFSGYGVPHRYGLSAQPFGGWFSEQLISLATNLAIVSPLVALTLLAIRRFPRHWWLVVWVSSIPVSIFLIVVTPVLFDPLYNDFKPLRDERLRTELLLLAEKSGIEGGRVFQVDKSKQTKTMNAYVTGLGPTKRIVLWDTLIAKMTREEILVVMAHEMAHYTRHHIWKGLAFGYAVMLPAMALGAWLIAFGVRRWGRRWGAESPGDPAALPWLFAVMLGGTILLTPVFAVYSRSIEHESDVIALELTGLREPAATAFIKFSEGSKSLPQPPAFIEYWYYTHPPLAKRIAFALGVEPVKK